MHSLPKSLFLFVFCVPLAIVLGVMLATPLDRTTLLVIFSGFVLLLTPFFLTSHHTFLILSWNAFMNAFFLPGKPYLWMLMVAISGFFILLTVTLNRDKIKLLNVPSVTWPLLAIGIITYVTAHFTGGVGVNALGSDVYGGKRYVYLWGAIAGYFTLSALPIDPKKRHFLASAFFVTGVTAAISNLAFMLGESFYFLFLLFPVEWAMAQVISENAIGGFARVGGLSPASVALVSYMLIRYGVRGTFNMRMPWRSVVFIGAIVAGLFSGFRATFLFALLLFAVQFLAEGLHKTKYLPIAIVIAALIAMIVVPFANRMPISVQRCLTLLPLDLDQAAVETARGSTDWRLELWRAVIPDIPMYLWMGKGYALDPKDIYFAQMHISARMIAPFEGSLVAGDYHNGPLTLIIPFGIWGVLAFLWFLWAAFRVLLRNYKYGDPDIENINRFMLTAFIVQTVYFLLIFGAFYLDMAKFVGIVGMSVALNRGVAGPSLAPARVSEPEPEPPAPEPVRGLPGRFQPAFRGGRA